MPDQPPVDQRWYQMLTEGERSIRSVRHLLGWLPSSPRCKICNAPFKGAGGRLMHLLGRDQSRFNPRYCESCAQTWLPLGIGIHTGLAYCGVLGGIDGNPTDFTALGDNVNIAARLASKARQGEILISDTTYSAAGLDLGALERRQLELKGKREPTGVRILRVLAA